MKFLQIIIFLLLFSFSLSAQEGYQMKPNNDYTEMDILTSYYKQDGNNAAVTGGEGTEELTDVASIIIINMPLDSTKALNMSFGADYYTSASTDNIDFNPSSASVKDIRTYINVGFSKKNLTNSSTYGVRLGFSSEYDYTSFNGGLNFAREFNEGNSELSINAQAFIDKWKLYLPQELRDIVTVPTTSRNSYNVQATYAQVINKKLQLAVSAEAIYMNGLLSTPFHRVYFSDQELPDIERLPSNRLKIPLAARATFFATEKIVMRSYYRFYRDDFGINAHTISLDIPFKVTDEFTITPFYRYHTQTASDYFNIKEGHVSTADFYTSDFDLAELVSSKYGIGIGYSPVYGIGRLNVPLTRKLFILNGINFRAAKYTRDTGLDAISFALELNTRF